MLAEDAKKRIDAFTGEIGNIWKELLGGEDGDVCVRFGAMSKITDAQKELWLASGCLDGVIKMKGIKHNKKSQEVKET